MHYLVNHASRGGELHEDDIMYQDLRQEVNNPKIVVKMRAACIPEGTWHLVDQRTVLSRIGLRNQWGNQIVT